jgi:hypothetical protein
MYLLLVRWLGQARIVGIAGVSPACRPEAGAP